jgi:DNA polymerase III delta subunit
MEKWAKHFFRESGFNDIPKNIIHYMIEITGDSLNHLKNEIDKIATNLNSKDDLTIEKVYQFSSWKKKLKEYEFFNLLGERNLKKSLEFGRMLVSHDSTLMNLLYPMTEFFQELLFIKISRGTNLNSRRYTQLPRSVIKNIPNYASNYSSKEVISALKRLRQVDRKIKTSRIDDESAITEFLYATVNNG